MAMEKEILLEYRGSRRVMKFCDSDDNILERIEREVRKVEQNESVVVSLDPALSSSRKGDCDNIYHLQKWSTRFGCFTDVSSIDDITDGDRVSVAMTKMEEKQFKIEGLGSKGISICNKIKQPSKADAQVLRNLFPASSGPSRKRSYTFDPTSQCVAADQQRKKKKAIRNRVSKVTILQVNDVARGIPKGKYRRELKKDGQEVVIELKRNMSAREVKNSLIRGTKLSNYQILAPSQDGKLVYAENQDPTGDEVIENITKRKFPMYISEKEHIEIDDADFEVSDDTSNPKVTSADGSPILVDNDTDDELQHSRHLENEVPEEVLYEESIWTEPNQQKDAQTSANLEEYRRIREEQDLAYQESLLMDKQKDIMRAKEREAQEELDEKRNTEIASLEEARCNLQSKYHVVVDGGIKVSFRLVDGGKIEHSFPKECPSKDLYEFVFVQGHQDSPFCLVLPLSRTEVPISKNVRIGDLGLGSACVLTVLEKADYPNPLTYVQDCGEKSSSMTGGGSLSASGGSSVVGVSLSASGGSSVVGVSLSASGGSSVVGGSLSASGGSSVVGVSLSVSGGSSVVGGSLSAFGGSSIIRGDSSVVRRGSSGGGKSTELGPVTKDDRYFLTTADQKRESFIKENFPSANIIENHTVRRSHLYDDVIKLYSSEKIATEHPLFIVFEGERAVDFGGVSRDMLSGFWEEAYKKLFDGCSLLTPVMHPQIDTQAFSSLGCILSHGYLVCGFLPVRIAFPTLACLLLGPHTVISDSILLDTFPDSLSEYEAGVLRDVLKQDQPFSDATKTKLIGVLSRFGCREVPKLHTLRDVLVRVARFEFVVKPLAAISYINAGVPQCHSEFWALTTVCDLYKLYLWLTATPGKIIDILSSSPSNENEERILGYLQQFIGSMKRDSLRKFLRFTTGSSVCLTSFIRVSFNGLTGFGRRPISHTCDCMLELPATYRTYPDFVEEFEIVLSQPENSWRMDGL